jgi:hypothetical protein
MSKTMDKTPVRSRAIFRWECRCEQPPLLLGTYEEDGTVHIKVRDRFWHIRGEVRTICLRCGTEFTLDLQSDET